MEEENKKISGAEKELAEEIAETEKKVENGKISQKQADKEINKEIKEEIEKTSKIQQNETISKESKKIKKSEEMPKKTEAVLNGKDLPMSKKCAVAICNYIRGKGIDKAISMIEEVSKFKRPIPMKGEIPHRKGKIMSGRYPIKASGEFIRLLKSLKSNAIANELELEKYVIFCKANMASRPYRRFGRTRFKRTHVTLKLIEPKKLNQKKEDKK